VDVLVREFPGIHSVLGFIFAVFKYVDPSLTVEIFLYFALLLVPGGEGGRCVRLTSYHPFSAERQENPGP
jgi:hypothetical protein